MIQTSSREYKMKPVVVEAWQLQQDNLELVAKWCKGRQRGLSIVFPKIRDKARLIQDQDTNHYAVIGDWVVRVRRGFVKMKNDEFLEKFDEHRQRL